MIDGDRLGVNEFAGTPIKVLEDHLRMRVGHQSLTTELLGHIENVVDLNDTKMRIESLEPWQVGKNVTAPSNVTLSRTKLEFPGGRAITLIVDRNVVDAVVRSTAEFPDVVGDFDGETVMEVSGHHKDLFAKLVPFLDQHLAFVKKSCPRFLFIGRVRLESSRTAVRNHERHSRNDKEEIGITLLHRTEQPLALRFPQHGNSLFVTVANVVHITITTRINQVELAVRDAKFSVTSSPYRIADVGVIDFGRHVDANTVRVNDFNDVVNVRVLVALVVIEFHVIDPRLRSAPMNMQIQHLIQRQLGEVRIGIVQNVAASLHGRFAKVDRMFVFHRVGPTQIVVPSIGPDVSKYGASVTLAGLARSPDIIHQFMVIECEITGDVAMPFGELDSTAQVELIVLPNPDHRWHDFDGKWQGGEAHGKPPRFDRVCPQLFIEPIAVHDVKMNFVGPVAVQMFVSGCPMPTTMHRILVGAGTDLKPEVEQPLGIVELVF